MVSATARVIILFFELPFYLAVPNRPKVWVLTSLFSTTTKVYCLLCGYCLGRPLQFVMGFVVWFSVVNNLWGKGFILHLWF